MASETFVVDETTIGKTIGPSGGGWLTRIQVIVRDSGPYVTPQGDIHGNYLAGGHLQIRATGSKRDLWCANLSTTPLGGSVGGSIPGSILMTGAIRYEGALQVIHCPRAPAQFQVTVDDVVPLLTHMATVPEWITDQRSPALLTTTVPR
jgi:hypothetical protein